MKISRKIRRNMNRIIPEWMMCFAKSVIKVAIVGKRLVAGGCKRTKSAAYAQLAALKSGVCAHTREWAAAMLAAGMVVSLQTGAQAVDAGQLPTGEQNVQNLTIQRDEVAHQMQVVLDVTQAKGSTDWQTFSVGTAAKVNFDMAHAGDAVLNRVVGNGLSEIAGQMTAVHNGVVQGQVILVNPNGILFSQGSQVNVGSLVASTVNISNEDFLAVRMSVATKGAAAIVNKGTIYADEFIEIHGSGIEAGELDAGKIVIDDASGGMMLVGGSESVTITDAAPAVLNDTVGNTVNQELPEGEAVVNGTFSFDRTTKTGDLTINQSSDKGIIDWQSYNVGETNTVEYVQPQATSAVLNRIVNNGGEYASKILGNVKANGQVFLVNSNGILFGSNARVNVGGIVASTLDILNDNFSAGNYTFKGNMNSADIFNYGNIETGKAAIVFAKHIGNTGTISGWGTVCFGALNEVKIVGLDGAGSTEVIAIEGQADTGISNTGKIRSDQKVALFADSITVVSGDLETSELKLSNSSPGTNILVDNEGAESENWLLIKPQTIIGGYDLAIGDRGLTEKLLYKSGLTTDSAGIAVLSAKQITVDESLGAYMRVQLFTDDLTVNGAAKISTGRENSNIYLSPATDNYIVDLGGVSGNAQALKITQALFDTLNPVRALILGDDDTTGVITSATIVYDRVVDIKSSGTVKFDNLLTVNGICVEAKALEINNALNAGQGLQLEVDLVSVAEHGSVVADWLSLLPKYTNQMDIQIGGQKVTTENTLSLSDDEIGRISTGSYKIGIVNPRFDNVELVNNIVIAGTIQANSVLLGTKYGKIIQQGGSKIIAGELSVTGAGISLNGNNRFGSLELGAENPTGEEYLIEIRNDNETVNISQFYAKGLSTAILNFSGEVTQDDDAPITVSKLILNKGSYNFRKSFDNKVDYLGGTAKAINFTDTEKICIAGEGISADKIVLTLPEGIEQKGSITTDSLDIFAVEGDIILDNTANTVRNAKLATGQEEDPATWKNIALRNKGMVNLTQVQGKDVDLYSSGDINVRGIKATGFKLTSGGAITQDNAAANAIVAGKLVVTAQKSDISLTAAGNQVNQVTLLTGSEDDPTSWRDITFVNKDDLALAASGNKEDKEAVRGTNINLKSAEGQIVMAEEEDGYEDNARIVAKSDVMLDAATDINLSKSNEINGTLNATAGQNIAFMGKDELRFGKIAAGKTVIIGAPKISAASADSSITAAKEEDEVIGLFTNELNLSNMNNGALDAGRVVFNAYSNNIGIDVGGDKKDGLLLTAADFAKCSDTVDTIQIGTVLEFKGNFIINPGDIRINESINLLSKNLTFLNYGNINQKAEAAVTVKGLQLASRTVQFDAAGNNVQSLAVVHVAPDVAEPANFVFRDDSGFVVNDVTMLLQGDSLQLISAGTVTQSGEIDTAKLVLSGSGDFEFGECKYQNVVAEISVDAAKADICLNNVLENEGEYTNVALKLGKISTSGDFYLSATADTSIEGAMTVGGKTVLEIKGNTDSGLVGDLTQTSGRISTGNLFVEAGNNIILDKAGNQIGVFGAKTRTQEGVEAAITLASTGNLVLDADGQLYAVDMRGPESEALGKLQLNINGNISQNKPVNIETAEINATDVILDYKPDYLATGNTIYRLYGSMQNLNLQVNPSTSYAFIIGDQGANLYVNGVTKISSGVDVIEEADKIETSKMTINARGRIGLMRMDNRIGEMTATAVTDLGFWGKGDTTLGSLVSVNGNMAIMIDGKITAAPNAAFMASNGSVGFVAKELDITQAAMVVAASNVMIANYNDDGESDPLYLGSKVSGSLSLNGDELEKIGFSKSGDRKLIFGFDNSGYVDSQPNSTSKIVINGTCIFGGMEQLNVQSIELNYRDSIELTENAGIFSVVPITINTRGDVNFVMADTEHNGLTNDLNINLLNGSYSGRQKHSINIDQQQKEDYCAKINITSLVCENNEDERLYNDLTLNLNNARSTSVTMQDGDDLKIGTIAAAGNISVNAQTANVLLNGSLSGANMVVDNAGAITLDSAKLTASGNVDLKTDGDFVVTGAGEITADRFRIFLGNVSNNKAIDIITAKPWYNYSGVESSIGSGNRFVYNQAASFTLAADNKTKVAQTANPPLTYMASGTWLHGGQEDGVISGVNLSTTATIASGAGAYPINISGGWTNYNYIFSYADGTLTVTPNQSFDNAVQAAQQAVNAANQGAVSIQSHKTAEPMVSPNEAQLLGGPLAAAEEQGAKLLNIVGEELPLNAADDELSDTRLSGEAKTG
ncbi:MAG: filamentous hemagglutinin N-terminal domain-containing protein [Negativicutes bacterium]|jgi:filamentous hemagglutinin family protein